MLSTKAVSAHVSLPDILIESLDDLFVPLPFYKSTILVKLIRAYVVKITFTLLLRIDMQMSIVCMCE